MCLFAHGGAASNRPCGDRDRASRHRSNADGHIPCGARDDSISARLPSRAVPPRWDPGWTGYETETLSKVALMVPDE
jgi:hypothetical protein